MTQDVALHGTSPCIHSATLLLRVEPTLSSFTMKLAGMSDHNGWDLPGMRQSAAATWEQPQSPYSSDESIEAWYSPSQVKQQKPQVDIPPLALPGAESAQHRKQLHLEPRQLPPGTPDPPATYQAAAASGFSKPPRHSARQHHPGASHLGFTGSPRIPVSWIGDSIDHPEFRPSPSDPATHEADTIKVASFASAAKQAELQSAADQQQGKKKRGRWRKWTLLSTIAGVAIGAAYKMFGDQLDLHALPLYRQHLLPPTSMASTKAPVQVDGALYPSCLDLESTLVMS